MGEFAKHRPSPALIVAVVALIAALAGTAVALPGKNTVDKNDIKKNAIKSKAIKNKQVKNADLALNSVDGSKIADASVGSADLAPQEPFHKVGDPNEPAFFNGGEGDCVWTNGLPGGGLPPLGEITGFNPVGFAKDALGNVYLRGAAHAEDGPGGDGVCDASDTDEVEDGVVFTLPVGYRPEGVQFATTALIFPTSGGTAQGEQLPAGSVFAASTGIGVALLDNAQFRAAAN